MLNIVLVHPEIPNNTGNIGRLCLGGHARLHLIEPLGFQIDDTRLKRAGLDYWPHIELFTYKDFDSFIEKNQPEHLFLLTSHAQKKYTDIPFKDECYLVFGKESSGLEPEIIDQFKESCFTIPMYSDRIRSLNLANAVAITLYEGNRQLHP